MLPLLQLLWLSCHALTEQWHPLPRGENLQESAGEQCQTSLLDWMHDCRLC